jgi:hypothetical protein
MTMDAGRRGAISAAAAVEDIGAAVMAAAEVAAVGRVVDANDDTPAATRRVVSRPRSGDVRSSAAGALTAASVGLVFAHVSRDSGREVGVFGVAGVFAGPVEGVDVDGVRAGVVVADSDELVVVLVRGPPELLIPTSPRGFSGRT